MSETMKAVIFDLDGVILDSNPVIERFWKSWTEKEAVSLTDALTREWIHGRKVGDTIRGLFDHVPDSRKKEIEQAGYEFDSTMQPEAIDGVVAFIRALRSLQIPIGVVTSSHHPRMLKMLAGLGIENDFTHFVTAHDVTRGKPHPEPYEKMCGKMNIPPGQCLVFEDAISGIQSAHAAGMQVIGIGNEEAVHVLIAHHAKGVIQDFKKITIQNRVMTITDRIRFQFA